MRLSLGTHQQQIQKQTLSPRMIQSMEILQLPVMALQERIEQEMNENPMLEVQNGDALLPEETSDRENPDKPTTDEKEILVDNEHNNADDFERLLNMGEDMPDQYDEAPRKSANRISEDADRKHDAMANLATRPETLNDYLLHQLGELDLDKPLQRMCVRIISALDADDGGLLRTSLDDLLPASTTEEERGLLHRALDVVQQLDPPGVAARDLRECLLLQLTPQIPYYEEVKTLICNHLEDLRDNRLPAIQRATGYSIEQIQSAWAELRKLNPRPAREFSDTPAPVVTPDVIVEQADDGVYRVRLEDDRIPSLYISNYYRRRLMNGTATSEEKEFIKQKVNSAQWLIDSIEQRRNTLLRVSQAIVDHQTRFLDEGPEAIEPLKMQQIAEKVGVHVTTVSRAVDDKWIQTPRGLLPLKRFFVGGTTTEDGEDIAWDTIRIKLQDLIDHEDKSRPLSDDELVRRLKAQGLNVARRTITKYRQKLNIPSSRQRRDWSKK